MNLQHTEAIELLLDVQLLLDGEDDLLGAFLGMQQIQDIILNSPIMVADMHLYNRILNSIRVAA